MQDMAVLKNVMVPMRDGVALACDIYSAGDDDLPRPVLLLRTPYSKAGVELFTPEVMRRGYVVCYQDIRGRFESEGEFQLFDPVNVEDAADTIAWLRAQPFCNGSVGMTGSSYLSIMQCYAEVGAPVGLAAVLALQGTLPAVELAPGVPSLELVAIFAVMLLGDYVRRNSIVIEEDDLREAVQLGHEVYIRVNPRMMALLTQPQPDLEALGQLQQRAAEFNRFVHGFCLDGSLRSRLATIARYAPWVRDFLDEARGRKSERLAAIDYRSRMHNSVTPHLGVCGWYESFIRGALGDFAEACKRKDGPVHRLIVTPTAHFALRGLPVGEREFPLDWPEEMTLIPEQPYPPRYGNLSQRWHDYWLKGEENGVGDEPPLTLFVMGRNEWRDEWEWPLARTRHTEMFLASGGSANGATGDGRLAFDTPAGAKSDRFTYDPANPVPTLGSYWLGLGVVVGGPFRQKPIEDRDDILFYTSEPLEQELEVTGPLTLKLWVSTSGADTDFIAKLVDVEPGGDAWMVTLGICRMRSQGKVEPGMVTPLEFDLNPTSYAFSAGHRLRLQVTSSDFPAVDRNPNTGSSLMVSEEMVSATQTVYHSPACPSALILPVIPAG